LIVNRIHEEFYQGIVLKEKKKGIVLIPSWEKYMRSSFWV
jgi:hypothetical protein